MDKTSESSSNGGLALVKCGLWLHIGLIGATAVAAGFMQWFQDPRLPWSPAVALFGCVLAVASWRRGFAVLEQAERAPTDATDRSSGSSMRNPLPNHTPNAPRKPAAVPYSASVEP